MQPQLSRRRYDIRINKGDEVLVDDGKGKSLSRIQRKQLVCLSMTFPVKIMLADAGMPRMHRVKPVLERIEKQAMALMKDVPRYDKRTYLAIDKMVHRVWNAQEKEGYNAATMVNAALYLAEEFRMHLRTTNRAERARKDLWDRLCGSLFTLYKHLDPNGWQDPSCQNQVRGTAIGRNILAE